VGYVQGVFLFKKGGLSFDISALAFLYSPIINVNGSQIIYFPAKVNINNLGGVSKVLTWEFSP